MRPKHYLKICIQLNSDIRESVSNFLFENGARGIIEKENELEVYFDNGSGEETVLVSLHKYIRSLQAVLGRDINSSISTEMVPQRDWNAEWRRSVQPIRVTENILIKPSWIHLAEGYPPVVLEIDPEMAFGSGEHATTKLTLRLIEKNIHPHDTLLDIGTGTGVLAIAALKLGASYAYAFDIDPIASQTAQQNARKNGVADHFFVYAGTLDAIRQRYFDMVAANVNRLPIIRMLPQISALLVSDGVCLLSGLLESEEQMIRQACRKNELSVNFLLHEQEWLAFETRKK
ncbi:50S ribosomal protein L11 methyltransferase [candidate division KSB1 bacterium]|nr:50S ribosomal protein L11 methyltransferase [candidate division KSB1 bacterium]RQW06085.1 MAG: 50S ribosomal protein L11 methyltransferase [candidate division KSB1 bacterium]